MGGLRFGLVRTQILRFVRYGSGRFDTILGESIVETAMVTVAMVGMLLSICRAAWRCFLYTTGRLRKVQ